MSRIGTRITDRGNSVKVATALGKLFPVVSKWTASEVAKSFDSVPDSAAHSALRRVKALRTCPETTKAECGGSGCLRVHQSLWCAAFID